MAALSLVVVVGSAVLGRRGSSWGAEVEEVHTGVPVLPDSLAGGASDGVMGAMR